ncbi:SUKH-3 domain-containing protein [Herbidospora cretacea]|uniref:SUKH-3 domain-containing protein n=1 Tax=Herbidospora cretacea TaxID=28444 RepID=UPI0009EE3DA1
MDTETERILARAGWKPGRQVDTSAWLSRLEADGFVMHDAAERFLREFGGLVVPHGGPGISPGSGGSGRIGKALRRVRAVHEGGRVDESVA